MASTAVTRACPNLHAGGLRIPGCDERPRPAPALLKIAYQVLKTGTPYTDLGAGFYASHETPRPGRTT